MSVLILTVMDRGGVRRRAARSLSDRRTPGVADALLAEGVDDYGPQKSVLILLVSRSQVGAAAGQVAERRRAASGGAIAVRRTARMPTSKQDLYRTLDELSRITGDARYVQALCAGPRRFPQDDPTP